MITHEEAWGATLLRLALGVTYMGHGYAGLAVAGPAATATAVVAAGYPESLAPLLAWYLILAHLVGGGLILVGLWTRIAALAQLPIMLSAVFLVHLSQGYFSKIVALRVPGGGVRPDVGGLEFPLLTLIATVALALLGPGRASLDRRRDTGRILVP